MGARAVWLSMRATQRAARLATSAMDALTASALTRADPAGSDGSTQQRQNYDSKPFVGPKLSSLGGMELVYALKLVLRRGT